MLLHLLLNWWAAYAQIGIPAAACPASPEGQRQVAGAVIVRAEWLTLFNTAVALAAVVALVAVLVTYRTRQAGDAFAARWRKGLLLAGLVGALVCGAMLATSLLGTRGCQFGEVQTRLPFGPLVSRTTVALVQTMLFFFIWSVVLTRLARLTKRQPWYNNSRYPV
jgi:hypothetical protein